MSERWRPASFVYRRLLRLYPRSFRESYALEMAETFGQRLEDTLRRSGRRRALRFCLTNYVDAIRTAGAEWVTGSSGQRSSRTTGMDGWSLDLRHAVRGLIARPGFSLVAVLTLALAIGANTAMFSVLQAVLLTPPPFRDPDRLSCSANGRLRSTPSLCHRSPTTTGNREMTRSPRSRPSDTGRRSISKTERASLTRSIW